MLFLLSPAKTLDYETPLRDVPQTEPQFLSQSAQLIRLLKSKTPADIAELMHLSDTLASLNVARYRAWRKTVSLDNARQAILAFNGDVYEGLDAHSLKPRELAWAQDHVRMLSGLYGVLRPFDLMRPYRLEMGTALANDKGPNLYHFWGPRLAKHLRQLALEHPEPVLVNLASQEYFKAVDRKALKLRVVDCVFEECRPDGDYKIISFMAKRARGLMVRFAVQNRIQSPSQLTDFATEGYAYAPQVSSTDRLVFRRQGS